jgi:hypothetical protein
LGDDIGDGSGEASASDERAEGEDLSRNSGMSLGDEGADERGLESALILNEARAMGDGESCWEGVTVGRLTLGGCDLECAPNLTRTKRSKIRQSQVIFAIFNVSFPLHYYYFLHFESFRIEFHDAFGNLR